MSKFEKDFLKGAQRIVEEGATHDNRTATNTLSVIKDSLSINLADGYPLLSSKHSFWKNATQEMIGFLNAETNINQFHMRGVKVWDQWALPNGDLGPIYGNRWRHWPDIRVVGLAQWEGAAGDAYRSLGFREVMRSVVGGVVTNGMVTIQRTIDQVANCQNLIKNNPNSRRIIWHGWDPSVLPDEDLTPEENVMLGNQALPPCHLLYHWLPRNGKLNLVLYIRSSDRLVGLPYNVPQSASLLHMMAATCHMEIGRLEVLIGDSHIYEDHLENFEVMQRVDYSEILPVMRVINRRDNVWEYTIDDLEVTGYNPGPKLCFNVAK